MITPEMVFLSVVNIVLAVITGTYASRRQTAGLVDEIRALTHRNSERLTVVELQSKTLYDIIVVETVSAAFKSRLVQAQSPLTATQDWHDLIPEDLRKRIHADVVNIMSDNKTIPTGAVMQILSLYNDELLQIANDNQYSVFALLGAARVHAFEEIAKQASVEDCL